MSDKRKAKEKRRAARRDAARSRRRPRVVRDERDRVHLVVLRDAAGRPQRLALSRPLFDDAWQNDLATAAANTAHGVLGGNRTLERTVELARSAMASTSRLAEAAVALSPSRGLACGEGCSHCCFQAVGVSPPEVFAIHEHLHATRTPEELDGVARRIREADGRTRGLSGAERFSPDLPCPFLEDQRCTIYAVRPLACRGANSLDADACERTLRDPEARTELLAGRVSVPRYVEPIRAFHAVAAGLQLSLRELYGLSMAPLELIAALRILFDDPEATIRRWLAGDDPFGPAQGADISHEPEARALSGRR